MLKLERYIDRPALDDLVRQANAGVASPLFGSDEATIVTLLADQFQRTVKNRYEPGTWTYGRNLVDIHGEATLAWDADQARYSPCAP